MISLDEVKRYLRVDFEDDDSIIEGLIHTARSFCLDILRSDDDTLLDSLPAAKTAVLYCISYLYEHREEADYHELAMSLRALMFSGREGVF